MPSHDQTEPQDVPISDDMIRLGQFLKLATVAEDGIDAKALLLDEAVHVNGEPESRRGRQLAPGDVVTVAVPAGTFRFRVTREQP